ncbi:hypothetical protein DFH94DRAFT_848539 [Russula ochroleuca]|uniref:Uncharacterized protein n=1 Tax=Russula ochroleuca TaxID=152965 RepID=A0A9P5MPT0_9AGAM|nr:hypothetical protein DFH94DRAFT_848539 [Russula ochroleuca]
MLVTDGLLFAAWFAAEDEGLMKEEDLQRVDGSVTPSMGSSRRWLMRLGVALSLRPEDLGDSDVKAVQEDKSEVYSSSSESDINVIRKSSILNLCLLLFPTPFERHCQHECFGTGLPPAESRRDVFVGKKNEKCGGTEERSQTALVPSRTRGSKNRQTSKLFTSSLNLVTVRIEWKNSQLSKLFAHERTTNLTTKTKVRGSPVTLSTCPVSA